MCKGEAMGGYLIKGKENVASVRRAASSNACPLADNGQSRCVPVPTTGPAEACGVPGTSEQGDGVLDMDCSQRSAGESSSSGPDLWRKRGLCQDQDAGEEAASSNPRAWKRMRLAMPQEVKLGQLTKKRRGHCDEGCDEGGGGGKRAKAATLATRSSSGGGAGCNKRRNVSEGDEEQMWTTKRKKQKVVGETKDKKRKRFEDVDDDDEGSDGGGGVSSSRTGIKADFGDGGGAHHQAQIQIQQQRFAQALFL